MRRWRVEMFKVVTSPGFVDIDAETEEEAKWKAEEIANWDDPPVSIEVDSATTAYEVGEIKEQR